MSTSNKHQGQQSTFTSFQRAVSTRTLIHFKAINNLAVYNLAIPELDQNISLEKVLEDEAAAMAFSLDAKYFDDFPVIRGDMCDDIAGRQYPVLN